MVEAVLGVLGGFCTLLVLLLQEYFARQAANAPEKLEEATDADLVNPDQTDASVRLSHLHDQLQQQQKGRGPTGQPRPPTGGPLPPGAAL